MCEQTLFHAWQTQETALDTDCYVWCTATTISSMAAESHPGIKAITLSFDDEANELNEVAQAVETAKLHPMTHIVHQVKPETTLCNLADWIDCYEEPFFSMAANDTISKTASRNNLTVVLNGLRF